MNPRLRQSGHVLASPALRPPGSEVAGPSALAFREEVAASDEFPETELERAGLAAGEPDDLAEGEGFVIGEKGDDFPRERVKVGGAEVIEVDLPDEGLLLLQERAEEEQKPGLPVGLV